MVFNGLFPIGTVVLLTESTKRVVIVGVAQQMMTENGPKLYDYVGVDFPQGYQSADRNYLFNQDQIEKIFFIGMQDSESLTFKAKADQVVAELRSKENK